MEQKEKDKFDALMRIAEFNIKQFNERRDYSWKIAFGFWGSIIGSIAVMSPYRDNISLWAIIPFGLLVILIHIYWLAVSLMQIKKTKNWLLRCETGR